MTPQPIDAKNEAARTSRRGDYLWALTPLAVAMLWVAVAIFCAFAAARNFGAAMGSEVLLSSLCGPFAFFDRPPVKPLDTIILALVTLIPLGLNVTIRRPWTSVVGCLGVSFWFMMGPGLTYMGV